MEITKQNITISGNWTDGEYSGKFEVEPTEGFWASGKFTAVSNEGYVTEVDFYKFDSGYVDSENNECTLSDSMNKLFISKIESYLKESWT